MRMWKVPKAVVPTLVVAGAVAFSNYGISNQANAAGPQQGRSARAGTDLAAALKERASRGPLRCAVSDPGASERAAIDRSASRAFDNGGVVTIPVYWHIITPDAGGANVSPLVPAQMQVLNNAFGSTLFAFTLAGLEVVPNDAWFFAEAGSPEEQQMKAALRKGGPESLNIYTTNGDVYLGWATLPFYYKFYPNYDGVVLWWAALPGTGLAGGHEDEPDGILTYDQGDTGTHEVGHWLGLNHTFGPGDGCTHPGDSVKDTPTEAIPQFFCAPRDSCTGAPFPGEDPITNFMDYVDDVCMDHFTPEQTKRMRKHWHAFRDKKFRD
jgi:hypothetical protein